MSSNPAYPPAASAPRPTVRVGTVVWGLVVIILAVLIIIASVSAVQLDPVQVLIGLLLGSGAALVVGGVLSALRKQPARDKQPQDKEF